MKKFVGFVLVLAILIAAVWVLFYKFEGSAPAVTLTLPSEYLKKSYEMSLAVQERGTGLRKILVTLVQQKNQRVLLEKSYEPSALWGLLSDKKVTQESFVIPVESHKYGMNDGEAMIRIRVWDYAWRGWNRGNLLEEEKRVVIDTKPPQVTLLTSQHNVEKGGTGLVIYQVGEADVKSGVMVGDNFFPGHSGMFDNPDIYACFFALDHLQGPGTQMFLTAQDLAGNVVNRGFYHYIRDRNFKSDVLEISDGFLESKMPDFNLGDPEAGFSSAKNPLLEKFMYVNKELREKNIKTILEIPQETIGKIRWTGTFDRLAGAATRSGFGDRRSYKYAGKEVGRSVHLGIDLASLAHAPIGAANAGRVIMAQFEGIFGNTVMIDHGFGLVSLYSHLNEISVGTGDEVAKGDIVGTTGMTGLAGGDHLHFSMIVHNTFVNPLEWWDSTWIKHNITSKIEAVK